MKEKLRHFPLLHTLSDEEFHQLEPLFKYSRYQKGEAIIHKGEPSHHLLFLLKGEVDIIDFDSEGGEVWIATITPGQFFGELALILDEPRSADAIATQPSTVAQLPRKHALELLTEHPAVAKEMMRHLALTIKHQNQHLHMLNQPSATNRIKALLLLKARSYSGGLLVVENLPSQAQLAKMANTSRETVSRTLSRLCKEGILEKDYRRLIIRKPEALAEMDE